MGLMPFREPRPQTERTDWFSRISGIVMTTLFGIVLGLQYWAPNKRMIQVLAAIGVFGIAWRLSLLATLNFLIFLLPYPKGTVFGSTNLAFILFVLVLWLLRSSLKMVPPARRTPVDLALFAMMLWYMLSFYNIRNEHALEMGLQNYLLFIAAVVLFFLIVNIVRTQKDLERFHQMQILIIFITCALAAYEAAHPETVVIPGLIDFSATHGNDFNRRDVRVGGTFRDYELLSEYCGLSFLLLILWVARATSKTRRAIYAALMLFVVYTMYTTVTRGIFVALMVSLPYMFYVLRRSLNPVKFISGVVALAVLAVAMNYYVSNYTNTGNVFERMSTTRFVNGVVPDARSDTWSNALGRALVHPILGQGPYYDVMPGFHNVWPHNVYLYVANLIGFPGLFFYLLLIAGLFMALKPTVGSLTHPSYADSYILVARVQLVTFCINELKIDFLRNPIYVFQVFVWFGTFMAAYMVSREHGVLSGNYSESPPSALPERRAA
jgi:O-antigen ligase